MGVAVPRALVCGWGLGPPEKVTGPGLLVNRYLRNKFHKKSDWSLLPPLFPLSAIIRLYFN